MTKVKLTKCPIEGLAILEPTVYGDERGYFFEAYNKFELQELGIDLDFVQDNQSKSKKGVLRGLHFQNTYSQSKLVRVLKGEVFDVAVDLRQNSDTFGDWYGVVLSEENKKQFLVPKGFAHGFLVLSEEAVFSYKCDEFYHPEDENGIIWNDPELKIVWPIDDLDIFVSQKDQELKSFKEYRQSLDI